MFNTAQTTRRLIGAPRRTVPFLPLAALVLALVAFPNLGSGQDASLAEGNAQVIAQGLTSPPADRVAWRVVTEQVPVRADARPSNRMPSAAGFVLANDVSVFVSDQDTKRRFSLAPGEAEFVPTGANQTWASLDDAAGSVYSIELADRAAARDPASGQVLVVGSSFAMPQGDYDLNLLRDVVEGGGRAQLTAGEFPVLVFATSGAIDVSSTGAGETARLGPGEGKVVRGDVSLLGRGDSPSTYVAAVIGAAVTGGRENPTSVPAEGSAAHDDEPTRAPEATPTEKPKATRTSAPEPTAMPDQEPAATPAGASVRISVRICRDGMSVVDLDPRGCQRADGNYRLALVAPDGTRLRLNDASKVHPSFVRWSGLAAGQYALVVGDLPKSFVTYSLDGYACCPIVGGYLINVPEEGLLDGTLYLLKDFPPAAVETTENPAVVSEPPVVPVASGDSDGDGVSDADELDIYGTSPYLIDSDGDTITDGVEANGSNGYLTKPAVPDSDGDGVDDNVEIHRGTSPINPDSR